MSTNYYNTLITVAPDSPTEKSVVPDLTKSSVASQQYQWITDQPAELTSDDVIFRRVAEKQDIAEADRPAAQAEYFQKGRACMRTSPLAKQYGWGIHHNAEGKVSLVAVESEQYAELLKDDQVKKTPAMKSSR